MTDNQITQEICASAIANLEMGLREALKAAFAEVLPEVLSPQPADSPAGTPADIPADIPAGRAFRSSGLMVSQGMLNQRQMAAFIKLFNSDEEEAKRWLEQNAVDNPAQRTAQRPAQRSKVVLALKRTNGPAIRASILKGVKGVTYRPLRNSGDIAGETLQNWRGK